MSRSRATDRVTEVRLRVRAETADAAWTCAGCGADLDVHQPDAADPDRLLGTCAGCGAWVLIQSAPGDDSARVLDLPAPAVLLAGLNTSRAVEARHAARDRRFEPAAAQAS